eukprot:CAMPEP_0197451478 /NCGR_PEP_ID=MMETSP1175-20131217/29012_1 /TAXON_ID=1003142 /ORGANISM="Triceratium dubium, Strain CCMP147" /LENGTH=336 /DNA_ID=CAMNT_0042984207 /DNA_START=200 /DNA_END=1210 /DNA_ORIENTATION=+
MLSTALNRSLMAAARGSGKRAAARYLSTVEVESSKVTDSKGRVDPMQVFDQIDTNGDGVLSRDEFKVAVEKMNYDDLLKIKDSLSRNELSFNPTADEDKSLEATHASVIGRRMTVTAEVAISKIFPAGFGWQTAAYFAENAGLEATDLSFFVSTAVGDGIGVCLGHTTYMAVKKAVTSNKEIDVGRELQVGVMLGSAAMCSGGIWQPTVNALQSAGWEFTNSVIATGGVCTLAFFTGLRLARLAYSPIFEGVEEGTYANLKADAALSVAVGGAAGCFLGTDVSYGAANWMGSAIGIQETYSPGLASAVAGTSTMLGFGVVQTGENLVYAKDKCWVD